jgi:hypothetical protein
VSRRNRRKVLANGRNAHDRFVKLDFSLLVTDAYRSLSPGARALLVEFGRLYNGENNGELYMSQRKAAEMVGVANHATAGRYLKELEEKGFIRTRVKGSFDNKTKLATIWVLAQFPYNHQPATRDYTRWRASPDGKQRAQKSPTKGSKSAPLDLSEWPDGCEIAA